MLNFKCSGLPNLDKHSKSDPYCVLWAVNPTKSLIGRTEVVYDNLNPEFVTPIDADYFFEESQDFRVEVYDADDINQLDNFQAQDLIGTFAFTMNNVVTARDQILTGQLAPASSKTKGGEITITATEKKDDYGIMQFSMNLSFETNSDHKSLFYTLSKGTGKHLIPVYKSECQEY